MAGRLGRKAHGHGRPHHFDDDGGWWGMGEGRSLPSIDVPQSNSPIRAMTLTDIQALPNKPDPRAEGYPIHAIAVRPTVSRCEARVERSYRLSLLPGKPSTLKGRFSFRHAVVATVSARLVEGRMDANGAPIALVGERVRLTDMLTFIATNKEKLNKTQGSLWELVAVSHVAPCPEGACLATGP